MADVITAVAAIRAAILGKDIKTTIADGIEAMNIETTNTTARQGVTEGKQTALGVRQDVADANEVIRETNETTRKSDMEVIKTDYTTYKGVMIAASPVANLQNQINKNVSDLADIAQQTNGNSCKNIVERMINGETVVIVCYGDSITFGLNSVTGEQSVTSYPLTLQAILRSYYNNNNITVINEGYSGRQSDELAGDDYIYLVTRHNPDMIILLCGINDNDGITSGSGVVVPVTDYKLNLESIIKKVGKPCILMSPTPYWYANDNPILMNDRIKIYIEATREIAEKYNTRHVDLSTMVLNDYLYDIYNHNDISPDNIHYSDAYYQRIAQFVFSFGLCYNDLIVNEDCAIDTYSSLWRNVANITPFTNIINPSYRSFLVPSSSYAELDVFVNKPLMNCYLVSPVGTSTGAGWDKVKVLIDDIDSDVIVSTQANYDTAFVFYDTKFFIGKLAYGLHKIKIVNNDVSGKNAYISKLQLEKTDNIKICGSESELFTSYTYTKNILNETIVQQTTTGQTGAAFKFIKNIGESIIGKKYRITVNPSGDTAGISLGTHKAKGGGIVYKYPKYALITDSTGHLKVFEISKTNGSSFSLGFSQIGISTNVAFNLNADNTLDIVFLSDKIQLYVNDVLSLEFSYSAMLIGTLDLWTYNYSIGKTITIKRVDEIITT